jgi:hypothetical protein
MPRCPQCYTDLNHLIYVAKEWVRAKFFLVYDKPEYSNWQNGDIDECSEAFVCPECDYRITNDEDKAKAFLQGKLKDMRC